MGLQQLLEWRMFHHTSHPKLSLVQYSNLLRVLVRSKAWAPGPASTRKAQIKTSSAWFRLQIHFSPLPILSLPAKQDSSPNYSWLQVGALASWIQHPNHQRRHTDLVFDLNCPMRESLTPMSMTESYFHLRMDLAFVLRPKQEFERRSKHRDWASVRHPILGFSPLQGSHKGCSTEPRTRVQLVL